MNRDELARRLMQAHLGYVSPRGYKPSGADDFLPLADLILPLVEGLRKIAAHAHTDECQLNTHDDPCGCEDGCAEIAINALWKLKGGK